MSKNHSGTRHVFSAMNLILSKAYICHYFVQRIAKKPYSKWCRQYLLDIGGFILKYCFKKSGELYASCRESWKVYLLITRCSSTIKFWAIVRKIADTFVCVVCEYFRIPTCPWYIKWAHCVPWLSVLFSVKLSTTWKRRVKKNVSLHFLARFAFSSVD